MKLELVWTYNEHSDTLSVDFPKPDFDPKTPILLNLSWGNCRSYFQTHDFFGRRPRTSYAADLDTLSILFPPYNLLELEIPRRIERQDNIHTIINRDTGYVTSILIKRALTSLLWDLDVVDGEASGELERRNTCTF